MKFTAIAATPCVMGPLGKAITLECLPPPHTRRWVARRKAEVVVAVYGELLTQAQACERYALSPEEFAGWVRAYERGGIPGLRINQTKALRMHSEKQVDD